MPQHPGQASTLVQPRFRMFFTSGAGEIDESAALTLLGLFSLSLLCLYIPCQLKPPIRSRAWLALSLVAVIALGLASRQSPGLFPAVLGKYPGDALWALMVFLGIAWLKPDLRPVTLAASAMVVACADEFSQLYQAPWLNMIRSTTLGHLVLGADFAWQDLCAYTVGIVVGALTDLGLHAWPQPDSGGKQ